MPTTTLDIASDYTVFDNYHTVSLTSQDGQTTVSSKRAIKETISHESFVQGIATVHHVKCRWHVFVAQLSGFVPQEHGYLTDEDGYKHYIDDISLASWDTRYELSTTAETSSAIEN